MTAIDELCQFLDGRNEEYDIRDNSGGTPSYVMVCWFFNLADRAYFYEYSDGSTKLVTYRYDHDLTPEQAIAATLGAGTCKVEGSIDYGEFGCWQYDLSCGCRIIWPDSEPPVFCPECGRRCVG